MADDACGIAGREPDSDELEAERAKPVRRTLRGVAAILGRSAAIEEQRQEVLRVAPYACPCVLYGETGAGKEVAARALHEESSVAAGPFIAVNCAKLSGELVEDELFGHEKGAFTNALRQRAGCFERAAGGTLFLDEANELPPATQAKLLRVLEDGSFERLGGHTPLKATCRVVLGCQRDLAEEVKAGRFREDLYYRVAVGEIVVVPLRERFEDLPDLVAHLARRQGVVVEVLNRDALELLVGWHWPGNVRELDRIVQRVIMLGGARAGTRLGVSRELVERAMGGPRRAAAREVLPWVVRLAGIEDARGLVEAEERKLLTAVYDEAGGDLERAAARIDWDKRKLARHLGLDPAKGTHHTVDRSSMPARGEERHGSPVV